MAYGEIFMTSGSRITKRFRSTLFYIGAVALCLPPVFVFVWMILTGLKTGVQNISYPPQFIFSPTLENFRAVFAQYNFFKYLMNSLIVAGLATGLSLLLGLPAAYSIAKYRQGRIGILILVARMTPFVSYLLPWYIIFRYLDLIMNPDVQRVFVQRTGLVTALRRFLDERGFLEVETPTLVASTPEGARDMLVRARDDQRRIAVQSQDHSIVVGRDAFGEGPRSPDQRASGPVVPDLAGGDQLVDVRIGVNVMQAHPGSQASQLPA